MKGGSLIYKCRRCGKEHAAYHVPNAVVALIDLVSGRALPQSWGGPGVKPTNIHACSDGRLGVTDLIGADEDAE